jgi:hypothetical protein
MSVAGGGMNKASEAAKWASKLAQDLPEEFKVVGFQEYLRFRLSSISDESPAAERKKGAPRPQEDAANPSIHWITELVKDLPEDHVIRENGSEEQKIAWAVIHLTSEGQFAINKAISDHIRFYLGVAPPIRQNINRALRKLFPKHLSREKFQEGKSYRYTPKPTITAVFADLQSDD